MLMSCGGVPLAGGLILTRVDQGCAAAGVLSYCTGFSLLVGAAAGAVVAIRERRGGPGSSDWLLAVGIALMAASLGCLRLGVASIAGIAVGIIVGRTSMRGATATP